MTCYEIVGYMQRSPSKQLKIELKPTHVFHDDIMEPILSMLLYTRQSSNFEIVLDCSSSSANNDTTTTDDTETGTNVEGGGGVQIGGFCHNDGCLLIETSHFEFEMTKCYGSHQTGAWEDFASYVWDRQTYRLH